MYENPFVYKRPLYTSSDEPILIQRHELQAKTLSGIESGNWYWICGGKKIGKTTFILSLIREMESQNYLAVMIKPEELADEALDRFFSVLYRKVTRKLKSAGSELQPREKVPNNISSFVDWIERLPDRDGQPQRIVFFLDSFEAIAADLSQEILRMLIALRQSRAVVTSRCRIQFVISGVLTTVHLQLKPGRSLSEFSMKIMLDDFRSHEVEEMLAQTSMKLGIEIEPGFSRYLYEATSGTAYLVQKICYRILERANLKNERPELTIKNAELAIESIIQQGETNIEMVISAIEKDHQLVDSLIQIIRQGRMCSNHFDMSMMTLLSLGALSEHNNVYRIRNRIYELAFRDYFTSDKLADLYFSTQRYQSARELISESVNQQADVKTALNSLLGNMRFICSIKDPDGMIKAILNAFMSVMDSTKSCSLMIVDQNLGRLRIVDAVGFEREELGTFKMQIGQGVAGWVAQVGRSRFIRDVTNEIECPDFIKRELALKFNIGAMATMPITMSGQIRGVVNLCFAQPREFSETEIRMLEIMAVNASLVLQNSYLNQESLLYAQFIKMIQSILREATAHADIDAIVPRVLTIAQQIAGTDKSYLVMRGQMDGQWVFRFREGAATANVARPNVEIGEGIAGHVIRSGRPYLIENTAEDEHYFAVWEPVCWEFAVPFMMGEVPLGCLVVSRDYCPSFSNTIIELLVMLADAVSVAIKNKRLLRIAETKTQQVITAHSIGEAISHENSLQEILNLIASESLNVLGNEARVAFVWIMDSERNRLVLKAAAGEAFGQQHIGRSLRLEEASVVTYTLKTGEPALVEDVNDNPLYRPTQQEIESELAVPLIFRNETIGVIDLQSMRPNDFDEHDMETLMAVARQAAVATKIGELCDVRIKELRALYRTGTRISASLDLDQVLQTICSEGLEAAGAKNRNISVTVLDPESNMPMERSSKGVYSKKARVLLVNGWLQSRESKVIQDQQYYRCSDAGADRTLLVSSPAIKSALLFPIIFNGRPVGIITMESLVEDDFGEFEVGILRGLANQAGVAIENARLNENLKQTQFELAKVLESAAIEEAVAGFTHDIKNISTLIAGETQWLARRQREGLLEESETRAAIDNINSFVKQIELFTNDLGGRAYKLQPNLRLISLKEVIDDAVYLIAAKARRQQILIVKNDRQLSLRLLTDPDRLVRAFFNVLTNAVDAMPKGGTLKVEAVKSGSQIRIFISDTGFGIPAEKLRMVVTPFYTTKQNSYGLGLGVTKRVIEGDFQGKLSLESQLGEGTTVKIVMPLRPGRSKTGGRNGGGSRGKQLLPLRLNGRSGMRKKTGHILVVNDDAAMLERIVQHLSGEGHRVIGTELGQEAVDFARNGNFDAVILDYHLRKDAPGSQTALDFVPGLKHHAAKTPIILTSASMDNLGRPETYCDYFLEINPAFWPQILETLHLCLPSPPREEEKSANPAGEIETDLEWY